MESHIEVMIDENLDIPYPKSIDDIIDDARKDKNKPQIAWVSVNVPERKIHRVNITIPEYELKKIDHFISTHKRLKNRSYFLAEATINYIEKHS